MAMNAKWIFRLCLIVLLSGCYINAEIEPDQQLWSYAQPLEKGVSTMSLADLNRNIKFSGNRRYENIRSLLIIRDGSIIFENYYDGQLRRGPVATGYTSNILAMLAIGILIDRGELTSIDEKIATYLPDYEAVFINQPLKSDITIRHLLTHRSGLSWNDAILSRTNPDNDINRLRQLGDWTGYVLNRPLEALPGTRFNFNSASVLVIAKIISQISGMNYEQFIENELFRPLGITQYNWQLTPLGQSNPLDGLFISMIDLARIGQLLLNKGMWENQQIVSETFIHDASAIQIAISNFDVYGYYFRRFSDNFRYTNTLSQNDVIFAMGETGNHLYIIPHKNMIIAVGAANLFTGFYSPSLFVYFDVVNSIIE